MNGRSSAANVPASPSFIDFLCKWLDEDGMARERWHLQQEETLSNAGLVMRVRAQQRLSRLATNPIAVDAMKYADALFKDMLRGRFKRLREFQQRYRFMIIVGAPRTGGSYLTKEAYSALGYEPEAVPASLAHDGFPDASPNVGLGAGWLNTLRTTCEYLTMVRLFFGSGAEVVVPKKTIKAVYASNFFGHLFGANATYLLTLRHPLASCISTYEKSGGLPAEGKFATRSNIEHWIRRDLSIAGLDRDQLFNTQYAAVYLRYWEQFHMRLGLCGLLRQGNNRMVAYGRENLEQIALDIHRELGSVRKVATFSVKPSLLSRHSQWLEMASAAMRRVGEVWEGLKLEFPVAELHDGI